MNTLYASPLALALWLSPPLVSATEPVPAAAASPASVTTPGTVLTDYSVDLSIPDSPGVAIVGLGTENVLRPSSPRALGMALLQGTGPDGKPRQGLAFDIAPTKLLMPGLSKQGYAQSRLLQALWNTQWSFGIGKPTSNTDKSTRIGLGLSTVLWRDSRTDPLQDSRHQACLGDALAASLPKDMPEVGPAKELAFTEAMKGCYTQLTNRTWNGSALVVGLATARVSGTEAGANTSVNPQGAWLSFGYGFEGMPNLSPALHLTATLRRMTGERVPDPLNATTHVHQDSRLLAVKLYRRSGIVNASVEVSDQRASISGRPSERSQQFVLGFERKLNDNLWLVAAMGSKRGGTAANQTFVTSGLKFGSATESVIKDR